MMCQESGTRYEAQQALRGSAQGLALSQGKTGQERTGGKQ